jgi:exportin-7
MADNGKGVSVILRALEEGLGSFDNTIAMQSCSAVDNICSYIYDNKTNLGERNGEVSQAFQRLLTLICQLVVSGEFSSTWSLSRPMFLLVLLEPNHFTQVSQQLASAQILDERRAMLSTGFAGLIKDVAISCPLTGKARESFTKNLYDLSQQVKTTSAAGNS